MTERGYDMQISRKRTPYRECPLCGSHLDAGEVCDCKQEQQAALVEREEKGLVAICREIDKGSHFPYWRACGTVTAHYAKNK